MKVRKFSKILYLMVTVAGLCNYSWLMAATYNLTVNGATKQGAVPHFWSECVGSGSMQYCLKPEWRNAMKIGALEAGFKSVRGHGILMGWDGIDRIGIFKWDGVGTPTYNWVVFDSIYDFLVKECKLRPIVELSFMPKDLQSIDQVSKPKNLNIYRDMIRELVSHCVTRYGLEEVRTWYWEVWNEPDIPPFWSGTESDYLQMYQKASEAVKSVDPQLLVGGPASSGTGRLAGFVNYCKLNNVKYDFLSDHNYGGGGPGPNCFATSIRDDNRRRATAIKNSGIVTTRSLNTEFNSSWAGSGGRIAANTISFDSHVNAPFIVKSCKLILDDQLSNAYKLPDVLSYWAISDVFDEDGTNRNCYIENNKYIPFGQVFGLINYQGVRKAAFNAYKLLHKMGTTRISLTGGTGDADGIDGFATFNADVSVVTVILYNFYSSLANQTAIDTVKFALNNLPLPRGEVEVRHYRIDTTHSNAFGVWLKQGKPVTPTTVQWEEMHTASNLAEMYPATTIANTGSAYTETFTLPRQAVSMLQFKTVRVSNLHQMQKPAKAVSLAFSSGVIALKGSPRSERLMATIYGLNGTLIKSATSQTGSIDVRMMTTSRGVYLVRAYCSGQQLITKFVR